MLVYSQLRSSAELTKSRQSLPTGHVTLAGSLIFPETRANRFQTYTVCFNWHAVVSAP